MDIEKIAKKIPGYIKDIARILAKEGFCAYLVGGSIRDLIMDRNPKDYDIGTDATPNDILKIFPRAVSTGAKFGAMIVLAKDDKGEAHPVDVTTLRTEEQYIGGRWPSKVEFTRNIDEDLSRRDFTINSIALNLIDLEKGKKNKLLLDPYDGMGDIRRGIVKAVGVAEDRLKEDALRVLRACRFASVLDFKVADDLLRAIDKVITMVDNLSAERVRDEFLKILYDSSKPSVGLVLLKNTGVLKIWIPELVEGVGVDQPEYHAFDVFEHALRTVDIAEDSVKLAALFHDIGKPRKKKGAHFYGHDVEGARMTKKIMKRLRFPRKEIERVARLVRWHMFYFPYDEEDFMKGKKIVRKRSDVAKWGDAAIRRFVKNVGGEDSIDDLIKLRIADATANPKSAFDSKEIEALQSRIADVRSKDMAIKVTDLDVNGADLCEIGIKPGPKMGVILRALLDLVIEEPTLNDKKKLLDYVRQNYIKSK